MRGVDEGSGLLYFNSFRSRAVDFFKGSLPFVINPKTAVEDNGR